MTKGYKLNDGVMPEDAAKYTLDKLGVVEETSSSVLHDVNTYILMGSLFYTNHSLYFHLFDKIVWPRFLEGIGK